MYMCRASIVWTVRPSGAPDSAADPLFSFLGQERKVSNEALKPMSDDGKHVLNTAGGRRGVGEHIECKRACTPPSDGHEGGTGTRHGHGRGACKLGFSIGTFIMLNEAQRTGSSHVYRSGPRARQRRLWWWSAAVGAEKLVGGRLTTNPGD